MPGSRAGAWCSESTHYLTGSQLVSKLGAFDMDKPIWIAAQKREPSRECAIEGTQCMVHTNDRSAFGDLVVDSLLDDAVDIWLISFRPVSCVRSHDACSLSGDPVCDTTCRGFCIDL